MGGFLRFFNTIVPCQICNLRCPYCYIGKRYNYFDNIDVGDDTLHVPLERIAESLTKERLGGAVMLNLCANGETLLWKSLPDVVKTFLELGHYVSVVTNLTVTAALKTLDVHSEVDLRGMDSEEAISVLERYIENAARANLLSVRIIHGKGTGALRSAVQKALKRNKTVKKYRIGSYGEGDFGVTVAEL